MKKLISKQDGYAMSWAIIMLIVVCIISVAVISVSTAMLKRSSAEYPDDRAYITARSAVEAVVSELNKVSATVYAGEAETYTSPLLPELDKTILLDNFSFDGHSDSAFADLRSVSVSRTSAEPDKLTVRAVAIEDKSKVTVAATVLRSEKTFAPAGVGDFGDVFKRGVYADTIDINNGFVFHAGDMNDTTNITDVYTRELNCNRNSYPDTAPYLAYFNGDFYYKYINNYSYTQTQNPQYTNRYYKNYLSVNGATSENWSSSPISTAFYDSEKPLIHLNDDRVKALDLTALKDEHTSNYFVLYNKSGTLNPFKEEAIGTADQNGRIDETTTITISDSEDYYLFICKNSELDLNLTVAPGAKPNLFLILDVNTGWLGLNTLFGSMFLNEHIFPWISGNAICRIKGVSGTPGMYIYGAGTGNEFKNGDSYVYLDTDLNLNGAIYAENLILNGNIHFNYTDLNSTQEAYTLYTWETGKYAVEWGNAE